MKMSFFGEDSEERKEIIIALLVILFFGIMIYMMDWFSTKPEVVELPQASHQGAVTDSMTYYKAETNQDNVEPLASTQLTDSDDDGIPDNQDHCPNAAGSPENHGCLLDKSDSIKVANNTPALPIAEAVEVKALVAPTDTDGDNVPDSEDSCPTVAGIGSNKGCPADSDADGVPDNQDRCPNVAGEKENHGCLLDTDGDNVPDLEDLCPTVAGNNKGCPADVDTDADGVSDSQDRCPNVAGAKENHGCLLDTDGDKVPDVDDLCPTVAGSNKGCPVDPDSDADGVLDSQDKCPNVAGAKENHGCVVEKPESSVKTTTSDPKNDVQEVTTTEAERKIIADATSSIAFITGSATLTQYSKGLLDKVANLLLKNERYNLLIRGHTDSQGDEALNFVLSQNRAKSTFDYLASKGISKNRMSHSGFGERKPIASNKTKAGRLKNRRVELKLFHSN